jgi:hypothetical protein
MALKIYECENCHTQYETEKEANACELIHQSISSVSNLFYLPQSTFPYKFDVELENGRCFTYHIIPTSLESEDEE